MQKMNVIKTVPLIGQVAAVSCGISGGEPVLDLDYAEDSAADADANFVLTDSGGIVEIQGTAEKQRVQRGAVARHAGLCPSGRRGAVRGTAPGHRCRVMARKLQPGAKLVLASHNPGKLAEIADLLRPHEVTVISAGALGLPEPEETATDFVGNARIKALAAARASGLPALADDSGFCVAALGGTPGVYSARWAGSGKDFAAAMARVNREMANAADRRAWFVAALCVAWPDDHTETFVGRIDGVATWPPRGDKGFGYDPMFVPRWQCRNVRRTGCGRQAHSQPPREGIRTVVEGVLAVRRGSLMRRDNDPHSWIGPLPR